MSVEKRGNLINCCKGKLGNTATILKSIDIFLIVYLVDKLFYNSIDILLYCFVNSIDILFLYSRPEWYGARQDLPEKLKSFYPFATYEYCTAVCSSH